MEFSFPVFAHGGNPISRWMAANVAVAQDPAGNLKPAKNTSTERIDGIVAMGRAMLPQEPRSPRRRSSWDTKGCCTPGFGLDHLQDPFRTSQHRRWG